MGEVLSARDRLRDVSVSRLAEGFRMARETVAKRLAEANVAPSGRRDGYPVYPLREAAVAILGDGLGVTDNNDPSKMKPTDRRAHYQAENERVALEEKCRRLIPAAEAEAEFADLVKGLVQFVDSLGDHLERAAGLTAEQVDSMNEEIVRQREALYAKLVTEEPSEAAEG